MPGVLFSAPPQGPAPQRGDGATASLSQAGEPGQEPGPLRPGQCAACWGLAGGPPSWLQIPLDSLASTCTAASQYPKLHGNRELLVSEHQSLGVQTAQTKDAAHGPSCLRSVGRAEQPHGARLAAAYPI